MGTTYAVTVAGLRRDTAGARRVQRCIDDVLANVDRHLSTYITSSEISVLNRNGSEDWIPVSDSLFAVLAAAHRVSVETGGAFDVTIAPLVRLWGFGPAGLKEAAPEMPPSPEFIYDATASTGYTWLELRAAPERAVRKGRTPLEVDVNGIAPGYAVDRVSGCIVRIGFPNHLVEIGGEVRAAGKRPDGSPWRVAIERPLAGAREAYVGVELSDLAISTSGGYRNFRRLPDGRTISHTIDPRTGEPVRHALASVTVVHPRAALADAYATALLVLGLDEGYALAQKLGLPALFLERIGQSQEFRERATPEFEPLRSPARQASLSCIDGSADEAPAATVHGAAAVPAARAAVGRGGRLLARHLGPDDRGRARAPRGSRGERDR
ncbi:MAG TPA: FAD:protein FMN transferase [Steroidobacteraceae bacterium]|nr:FAD:protein FMN transferase [Steroidobacteraceae bacterium]